jgi:hypothetical protein
VNTAPRQRGGIVFAFPPIGADNGFRHRDRPPSPIVESGRATFATSGRSIHRRHQLSREVQFERGDLFRETKAQIESDIPVPTIRQGAERGIAYPMKDRIHETVDGRSAK